MRAGATISHNKRMQTAATPAIVPSATIQDFLEAAGVLGVPDDLTVSSIGVYNRNTGEMTPCDTSSLFAALGAIYGEQITFSGSEIKISRFVVMADTSSA